MTQINQTWKETTEWQAVLKIHNTKRMGGDQDQLLVDFWKKNPNLTLCDFEISFRENNIPCYFFAENPDVAIFHRGSKTFHPITNEPTKYFLSKTTKSLEAAKKEFPEEYFESSNLERLKDCGFACTGAVSDIVKYATDLSISNPKTTLELLSEIVANDFINQLTDDAATILFENHFRVVKSLVLEHINFDISNNQYLCAKLYLLFCGWHNDNLENNHKK